MFKHLSLCAFALACSLPALALTPIKSLSGEMRLSAPVNVTGAGDVAFRAQLTTRTGAVCEMTGTLKVIARYADEPRRVEVAQNGNFVHCPGVAPALVSGQVLPVAWTPPQMVLCASRSGRTSTCNSYSATVEAGTTAQWITWHFLNSANAAQKK